MKKQNGLSIVGLLIILGLLAFVAVIVMKLFPSYTEFFSVKKMLIAMEQAGDTKGSVRDIRAAFDRRAQIDYVDSVKGEDLEITKEDGEVIVTATYQKRIPLFYNISACLDFTANSKGK